MPRAVDHLVIAAHDLPAQAALYRRLGFQVGARNRHPWGTENHIVQFDGAFLELIGLGDGFDAPASERGGLSLRRLPRRTISATARGAGDARLALRRRGGRPARLQGGGDRRLRALRFRPQGAAARRTRGRGRVLARLRRQPGAARGGFLRLPAAFPREFLEPRGPGPSQRRARRRRADDRLRAAGRGGAFLSRFLDAPAVRGEAAASRSPPRDGGRMRDAGGLRRALRRRATGPGLAAARIASPTAARAGACRRRRPRGDAALAGGVGARFGELHAGSSSVPTRRWGPRWRSKRGSPVRLLYAIPCLALSLDRSFAAHSEAQDHGHRRPIDDDASAVLETGGVNEWNDARPSPFWPAVAPLGYDSRELWAWDDYRASVLAFVEAPPRRPA